jgi:glutathione S-transferase
MASYIPFGRQNSGCFAVQVALEEIGVAYERVWVPLESTNAADWRAINPTGRVPALTLPDGTLVFESAAIRERATGDYFEQLEFLSRRLQPYLLGAAYSIADAYLYMLASWFPPDVVSLHARVPRLAEHAKARGSGPAIAEVEGDHRA